MTIESDKVTLRELLAIMRSDSPLGMTPTQFERLGKLAYKYKYDPEFLTDMFVQGVRKPGSNRTRSRR